ncbi:PLAC8 family-domain-containing protein [Mycena sp. CBHHK59/15]|nr:PLAC8 family-domain-containing protein [Mycena sp. CBHHK59/15]
MQAGGSRNAKNLPMVDGQREWSNDVFDCLADPLTCLVSWFLPCVSYGRLMARYQALENSVGPSHHVCVDLTSYAIKADTHSPTDGVAQCFGCGGLVGMGGRQLIRSRYAVRGDGATDCLLSCCCAPCALTQESREIELEEQSLGHPGAGFSMFTAPQGQGGAKA